MRQHRDELIATVAEGEIDAAQGAGDDLRGLCQHAAAGQVAVLIVYLLEVVEVQKEEAERLVETAGALDLRGQHGGEVARVEQVRAVVGDGEFLNALYCARIFDGDGGVVAHDVEKGDGVIGERLRRRVRDLEYAEGALAERRGRQMMECGWSPSERRTATPSMVAMRGSPCRATHPGMPVPKGMRMFLRASSEAPWASA